MRKEGCNQLILGDLNFHVHILIQQVPFMLSSQNTHSPVDVISVSSLALLAVPPTAVTDIVFLESCSGLNENAPPSYV